MGRFDALTQLEESQEPQRKLESEPVAPVKPPSPAPLVESRVQRDDVVKKAAKKPASSPVPQQEANARPVKLRHGFDIYWDQYEALLELSTEERREGGAGSMSAMVRDALDKFIAERRKK
jgi:hypothetical protein